MTPPPAWVDWVIEWHAPGAYILAVFFPTWRWLLRRLKGIRPTITVDICLHQAATGFVAPAFLMLCLSYLRPELVTHISPHEMGVAGFFALVTSLAQLASDGSEKKGRDDYFG